MRDTVVLLRLRRHGEEPPCAKIVSSTQRILAAVILIGDLLCGRLSNTVFFPSVPRDGRNWEGGERYKGEGRARLHLFRRSLSRNKARRGFVRFLSRPAKKINFERRHGFSNSLRPPLPPLAPRQGSLRAGRWNALRTRDRFLYSPLIFFPLRFSFFTRNSPVGDATESQTRD